MNHVSFGSTLKEARIAKGYDINTVARRLRIRPDILEAIEASDFERIPPRGYARNMINAYAHLLGLDANEVTRMYLDEAYANSVGVAHGSMTEMRAQQRATAYNSPATNGHTSSFDRVDGRRAQQRVAEDGTPVNGLGRRTYALEIEDKISGGANRTAAARMGMGANGGANQPHRSHRSALDDGRYLNAVEGRASRPQIDFRAYLPYALGILIVLVLLFVILNLTVCHKEEPADTIPVTSTEQGSQSTEGTGSDGSTDSSAGSTVAETKKAPTNFTLAYKVADGTSTYIEVKVDGKIVTAADITGPKSEEFTSSDTIQFVASDGLSGITLTIDGEEQKLKEDSSGMYNKTFKFKDILKQWKKDHPDADSSSSSSSKSGSSTASSSGTTSGTSSTGSTTGTSGTGSGSSSSDSSTGTSSSDSKTLAVTGSTTTSAGTSGASTSTSAGSDSSE